MEVSKDAHGYRLSFSILVIALLLTGYGVIASLLDGDSMLTHPAYITGMLMLITIKVISTKKRLLTD